MHTSRLKQTLLGTTLLSIAVMLLGVTGVWAGEMVKWVDAEGRVHYGDHIPPEYAHQSHQVINKQGVAVKTIEAAKSKEEAEAEQREMRLAKEQAINDKLLLDSYTSEQDIINMRDRWIVTIDEQTNVTRRILDNLNNKKTWLEHRAQGYTQRKEAIPEEVSKDLQSIHEQIASHNNYVESQHKKQEEIRIKFDYDLKRFRELKSKSSAHNDTPSLR